MLSPSGSLHAATSCPAVSIPRRFPVPLPSSDCCCSEPLQRSRFTSHKSVWRGKGREQRCAGRGEGAASVPAAAVDPVPPPRAGGRWSPCGDPVPGLPLHLSCVAGEMPKMDQRATEGKRASGDSSACEQVARFPSCGAARRAAGTMDRLMGIQKDSGIVAIRRPEPSSPLFAPAWALPARRLLQPRFKVPFPMLSTAFAH